MRAGELFGCSGREHWRSSASSDEQASGTRALACMGMSPACFVSCIVPEKNWRDETPIFADRHLIFSLFRKKHVRRCLFFGNKLRAFVE
jgi:hypothetical protein